MVSLEPFAILLLLLLALGIVAIVLKLAMKLVGFFLPSTIVALIVLWFTDNAYISGFSFVIVTLLLVKWRRKS